ncbi:MAG TPA: PEGA domain-containing protein, partial [Kofleriaceae bacterium]
ASSPGTIAAPGTAAPRPVTQMPVTPPVFPPRRVVKLLSDTGEGTEIYTTADLEDAAETIKGARPPKPNPLPTPVSTARPKPATRPPSELMQPGARPSEVPNLMGVHKAQSPRPSIARADEPTLHAPPPVFGDATDVVRPAPDEEDSENHFETVLRDGRLPIPSGPPIVPTRVQMPIEPARAVSESSAHAIAGGLAPDAAARAAGSGARGAIAGEPRRRNTPLPGELTRARRKKLMIAIGALAALAFLSFMIALAAKSVKKQQAALPQAAVPQDAARVAMQVVVDAALPLAPPPLDAAPEPTVPDAAPPVDEGMAYLIVRTIPDGGMVKVGDQHRLATKQPGDPTGSTTAQLVLQPGKHVVTAELTGYQPEKRMVVLAPGDNQRIEVTFTKKIVVRPDRGPGTGRLTVRTTPWSDVYLGSKKLGQAPFADLELPAGTHTLTFKNPSRPTVTKTVTIKAGKSAKLNFSLP